MRGRSGSVFGWSFAELRCERVSLSFFWAWGHGSAVLAEGLTGKPSGAGSSSFLIVVSMRFYLVDRLQLTGSERRDIPPSAARPIPWTSPGRPPRRISLTFPQSISY